MHPCRILTPSAILAAALVSTPMLAQEVNANQENQARLTVTAVEAFELMQENQRAVLIDVRDPVEIKFTGFAGPTDIHVPLAMADRNNFDQQAKTWPMVRNTDFKAQVQERLEAIGATEDDAIIVMCRSGTRSSQGADIVTGMGYSQVYSVNDGFEGRPLKEGDSKGVRALGGWRNSGLPWSYEIDPAVAWRPTH